MKLNRCFIEGSTKTSLPSQVNILHNITYAQNYLTYNYKYNSSAGYSTVDYMFYANISSSSPPNNTKY
jgi:hypothetical protein